MSILNTLATLFSARHKLRAYSTPGGIHPERYKQSSLRSRIMPTPVPSLLILALGQHQGSPAIALVTRGQRVLKYQKIAAASSLHSAPVHAPTSGTIVAIVNSAVAPLAPGLDQTQLCIHLQPDGEDEAIEIYPTPDYHLLAASQLRQKIADAGICGMGGAGFVTAAKLELGIVRSVELLIINALECEPYISADEALIRERASDVVQGAEILQAASNAERCVIAIEDSKTDAISKLVDALQGSAVELIVLKTKYPAGGEKQLIQAVSSKEVPAGQLPADIGVLLQNAGTAYAVFKAVSLGEPCVSRITTLTGSPLLTPKNFETPLGVPISFLFELCGLDQSARTKTIIGGSMMGIEVSSNAIPVTKTTNCVIAASKEEFPEAATEIACIRCGYCASVCPANLLPQQLLSHSKSGELEQLQEYGLFDCIECGACAYVCPSKIPLVQYYRASKAAIRDHRDQQQRSTQWQDRFQFHQYRIKKSADEALDKKSRNIAKTTNNSEASSFSRDDAKQKIADAVARVQARRSNMIASSKPIIHEKKPGAED